MPLIKPESCSATFYNLRTLGTISCFCGFGLSFSFFFSSSSFSFLYSAFDISFYLYLSSSLSACSCLFMYFSFFSDSRSFSWLIQSIFSFCYFSYIFKIESIYKFDESLIFYQSGLLKISDLASKAMSFSISNLCYSSSSASF